MKKQFLTAIALIIMSFAANAQVGIGTATPNSGAALDITSTDKGLLLPRLANTAAIASPVNGMMIYDLSSNCFKAYQNGGWSDCGLTAPVTDQIQAALTTSQAAYIAAPTDTWVAVTATEYDAVLAGVTGAAYYGTPNATYSLAGFGGSFGSATLSVNSVNSTQVPATSYPIALRFKTVSGGASVAQLKFGATAQNSYFNYLGATPTFTAVASGALYFVAKAPSTALSSIGYIALYTSGCAIELCSVGGPGGSNVYYDNVNTANGNNLTTAMGNYQSNIQVIATPTKTW